MTTRFLTTVLALGTLFMLSATHPTEATLIQPIVSEANHAQVTPAGWGRGNRDNRGPTGLERSGPGWDRREVNEGYDSYYHPDQPWRVR